MNRWLTVVVALGLSVITLGTASAHSSDLAIPGPGFTPTVLVGRTAPTPGQNNGESATFVVTDTGRSIIIVGRGRGMAGAKVHVSLLYPDAACATQQNPTGLTFDGTWQGHGRANQFLFAEYVGEAYAAVTGELGSISIREVTTVSGGAPVMTASLTARACAPLVPR